MKCKKLIATITISTLLTATYISPMMLKERKVSYHKSEIPKDPRVEKLMLLSAQHHKEVEEKRLAEEKRLLEEENAKKKWIDIRVSYYTNSVSDCGNTNGITASGKSLKHLSRGGDVDMKYIATPKNIPFGTKIYVEGIGKCEAVDTGSAIQWHGNTMWIDVFVPRASKKELDNMGIKYTKGYILEK